MRIQLAMFNEKTAARLADIEAGRAAPVATRDASTVVILRPAANGNAGAEVLMMRRPAAMKFAPGAYVFPGGSVDPDDYNADIGWHGPSAAEFGVRLGASADEARALVCAAVRETYEEAGVLLAGEAGGGPLAVPSGPEWEADRVALTSGKQTLPELLNRRGLVLRADLLVPWARWVTPVGESRRFDARFFAALLPPGQQATGHAAEADHVVWVSPADALNAARAGEMSLFPPTAVTLHDFASGAAAGHGLPEVLGAQRTIEPIQPRMVRDGEAVWLELPDEVEYPL